MRLRRAAREAALVAGISSLAWVCAVGNAAAGAPDGPAAAGSPQRADPVAARSPAPLLPPTSQRAKLVPPAAKPAAVTFDPVTFAVLTGWDSDDHLAALKAFLSTCPRIVKSNAGGKAGKSAAPPDLIAACEAALKLPAKPTRAVAKAFFENTFVPHRVVHGAAEGLVTGYFEPLLDGSRTRDARFATPLHRRPADLVTVVDEAQRGTVGTAFTHARMTPKGLVPFPTRAEIEAGALDGQKLEFIYLADPVDVFFLQVQGSGRIRLQDGAVVRVHYDGKNGHPYTSIGRYLIDKGLVAADKMSLGALGRWLRADPARGRAVMHQNASYVFFREMPGDSEGPLGVLEVPLTAGRSIAVDPSVHPLGSPIYLSAPTLVHARKGEPYHRLMVAHDVGSAIRGPERADIYFGSGDAAGRIAGLTRHPGHLFVLKANGAGGGNRSEGGTAARPPGTAGR